MIKPVTQQSIANQLMGIVNRPDNGLVTISAGVFRELARTWLRTNDAPVGHLRDSIDFDGDTGMDESQARALVGQRIRLVPEADSGGEE